MSYDKKSILEVLEDIRSNKTYLPAIQRRFVWPRWKIEKLFDSIMRNYPIGSFLFWQLKDEKANDYVFYEFLKNYDERHPYNQRFTGSFGSGIDIVGVLDGQQRLSALYLGLQGTHKQKLKNFKRKSDHAYPETSLYLNLLSLPISNVEGKMILDREKDYEFRFLTSHQSQQTLRKIKDTIEYCYWFKVNGALRWTEDHDFDSEFESLCERIVNEDQKLAFLASKKEIRKTLSDLHKRLNEDLINYYNIKSDDLEDILEIFVRVNSQGMVLSKSDLMFSTIVATWPDGRDQIEDFLKEINIKGEGFSFHTDFLMRSCLVLTDLNVLFKVNSFKADNVLNIMGNWEAIKMAIRKTVDLLVKWGLSKETLTSQNAVILISYHFFKGGNSTQESEQGLYRYLMYSLLQNVYGGQGDQVIDGFRNVLRKENVHSKFELVSLTFPFDEIRQAKLPANKTLDIRSKDIDNYLSHRKGPQSFFVLSILYPNLRFAEVFFHQDHIHPSSKFNGKNLSKIGLTEEEQNQWKSTKDCVPNLQLLEGRINASKNDTPFEEWLNGTNNEGPPNVADKQKFLSDNYIDDALDLSFASYMAMFTKRREKLSEELHRILQVKKEELDNDQNSDSLEEYTDDQVDYSSEGHLNL